MEKKNRRAGLRADLSVFLPLGGHINHVCQVTARQITHDQITDSPTPPQSLANLSN